MTRREFSVLGAAPFLQTSSAKKWNILWISIEDISPTLGCYGDAYAKTPRVDHFATEGVRYDNAHSVYPVCAPSRSSIITGMYPATIGSHHMRSLAVPPPEVKCFTEYLRAAGYYCSNNAKTDYNFNGPSNAPLSAWDDSSNTAHWRNREKDQPFFSVFNIQTTHESQLRDLRSERTKKLIEALPKKADPAKAAVPPYYADTPVIRKNIADYYDTVAAMDGEVQAILRQLDEDGLRENTVVFFWGDHGWGMPRGKRWLYDSGTRVPLIVRAPGMLKPGSNSDELVSLFDLGPTVLSLAGVPIPRHMQAQPFLGEQKARPREYVFMARDRMDEAYDMIRSVRDKRFRYNRNYQWQKPYLLYNDYMDAMPAMKQMRSLFKESMHLGPQGPNPKLTPAQLAFFGAAQKPKEELYDTVTDPHEIQNLADRPEHQTTLQKLRKVHEEFMKRTRDLGEVPEAELVERMRPGGKWQTTEKPVAKISGTKLEVSCATAGSSLVYTQQSGEKPHWKLYSGPVSVRKGDRLRVRACRLGYLDSEEVQVTT